MRASASDLWEAIALGARDESILWGEALLPSQARERVAVFSPLAEERFALGLETIYEGYLLHYGRPRLFAPPDADTRLLLGDYLYAHGLVRISALRTPGAVEDLGELIALCAQLRADRGAGDGEAWAATAALLGRSELDAGRTALRERGDAAVLGSLARAEAGDDAVERALAAHRGLLR